jgi:hypothetical protein
MESDGTTTDPAAAAAQLAALQVGREQVASRARQPWWYDPATGLVVFLLLASIGTHSIWWIGAGLVVFAVGLRLLGIAYRRATGFWVSGLRQGRTRRATNVWLALYAMVIIPAAALDLAVGWRWSWVVAGAVLGTAIALISHWWTTLYIAELREEG